MEFPGIISKGYKMPEDDTFFVMEEVGKILGVQLESVKLIEIYITMCQRKELERIGSFIVRCL